MPNQPIYLVVQIPVEDIVGDSAEAYEALANATTSGLIHIEGLTFAVNVLQASHGRYPS